MKHKLEQYFEAHEIAPLPVDIKGKIVILNPTSLRPECRTRANLLWLARGGFGCDSRLRGRAVFATCIGDGEEARWDCGEFIAMFVGDVEKEKSTQ